MNKAESNVNKYACKKATNNSNTEINKVIGTDKPAQPKFLFIKIVEINAKTMMWPAVMFANKRIINANGFVKIPTISKGIIIGIKATGTPGGQKMCFQ